MYLKTGFKLDMKLTLILKPPDNMFWLSSKPTFYKRYTIELGGMYYNTVACDAVALYSVSTLNNRP